MTAILAIDAAWTPSNPSGVALVAMVGSRWRCRALAPSYEAFYRIAEGAKPDWRDKQVDRGPDPDRLVATVRSLAGDATLALVTVDMPLSRLPITARREADRAIACAFGRQGCSTHSPSGSTPGAISETLRKGFGNLSLATTATKPGTVPALLEVYPHPAILALTGEDYRLPYKVSRSSRYWKGVPAADRQVLLLDQYRLILSHLCRHIDGIGLALPEPGAVSMSGLKAYEDGIDALVCAWVGIEYLAGRATAYGDTDAAVWVPT